MYFLKMFFTLLGPVKSFVGCSVALFVTLIWLLLCIVSLPKHDWKGWDIDGQMNKCWLQAFAFLVQVLVLIS